MPGGEARRRGGGGAENGRSVNQALYPSYALEEGTDRVIGAHLLGPHADETINLIVAAIRLGIPAGELGQVLFAYPTFGSDIRFML